MRYIAVLARREVLFGALAGLLAGVVFALAMQAEQMRVEVTGLAGVSTSGAGLVVHLVLATLIGAVVGMQYRHEPGSYAAQITLGVTFGLLGWILGPLTIRPLAEGQIPDWSIAVASAGFPSLMGHMLYGALTIGGLYWAVDRWGGGAMLARPSERAADRVHRIVVLGGGFGGMSAAQTLERMTRKRRDLDVTLVSQSNFLLFTPMLAEVASSALEAQHIAAPIRAACPFTNFIHGDVERIDTEKRQVLVHSRRSAEPQTVPYDHLVLAMGSVPNFYGLPGLAEHAITLKTLEDAVGLRHRVLSQLERADHETDVEVRQRLLTFVVAGGGFGAETIAELFDLVSSVRRYYQKLGPADARFVLVHSRDRILPELSAELGAYALEKLSARGIEFRLGRRGRGGCRRHGHAGRRHGDRLRDVCVDGRESAEPSAEDHGRREEPGRTGCCRRHAGGCRRAGAVGGGRRGADSGPHQRGSALSADGPARAAPGQARGTEHPGDDRWPDAEAVSLSS